MLAHNWPTGGIRGKAVAPGLVWAPRIPAERPAKEVEKVGVTTRLDRPAQPEDISPAYVFLAAPCCSSYITGIVQPITATQATGPEAGAGAQRQSRSLA